MEHLTVIKNKFYIISFFLFFSTFFMNAQNNDSDFFSLYKEGELYKKEVIYIYYNKDFKSKTLKNKTVFTYKDKFSFIYHHKTHTKNSIKKSSLKDYTFSKITDLYKIEKKIIDKRIEEIEKEHGFKPIYPLKHIALKIYLVKQDHDCVKSYEVEWSSDKF